jgi:hypothetical protein
MDRLPLNTVGFALAVVAISILFIVWWPLAVIWSVNTLFQTGIPYSLKTWTAAAVLVTVARIATFSPEKRRP